MAYVPQFIPTDKAALQGILETKQKYHDFNTAKQEELASKIAEMNATRDFDIQQKDKFRNQLQETITNLDKEYNFDRSSSAYSEALGAQLRNLKADPYWSYKTKADETEKAMTQARLEMKGNYFSPYDPFAVDPNASIQERMQKLNEWSPYDLTSAQKAGILAGSAKAKKQHHIERIEDPNFPGHFISRIRTGYGSYEEAYNDISQDKEFIDQQIMGTEFAPYVNDPAVRQRFIDAAANAAVGETKWDLVQDPYEIAALRKTAAPKPSGNEHVVVGQNVPVQSDYDIRKADDFKKVNDYVLAKETELATLQANLDSGKIDPTMVDLEEARAKKLSDEIFDLQVRRSQARAVMEDIDENTPEGVAARNAGTAILSKAVPGLDKGKLDTAYNNFRDAFLYSNAAQRGVLGYGLTRLLESDFLGYVTMQSPKNQDDRLRSVKEYFADAKAELVKEDAGHVFGVDPQKHEGFLMYDAAEKLLEEAIKKEDWSKYKTRKEQADRINELWQPVKESLKEFDDFYRGTNKYAYQGPGMPGALPSYAAVEEMTNKALKEGVMDKYNRVVPSRSVKKTERDQTASWFGQNLDYFDMKEMAWSRSNKDTEKRKGGQDDIVAKLKDAAMKGNVYISYLAHPDAPLMVKMEHPDGTKATFEVNPEKLGPESSFMLAADIDNQQVRNSLFAGLINPMKLEYGVEYNISEDTPMTRRMETALGKDLMDNIRDNYPDLKIQYIRDIDTDRGETTPSKKYVITLEDGTRLRFNGRPALANYLMDISGGDDKLKAIQERNAALRASEAAISTEEETF